VTTASGPELVTPTSEPESVIPVPEPEPEPPKEYPLAKMLNSSGNSASANAWAGLYRLWGYDSDAATDEQACAQAPAAGLRCMQSSGSWGMLQRFDRPAILLLVSSEGRMVPVLLQHMMEEQVTLEIDGQVLEVPRGELEKYWYGVFRLLWKTPPSGAVALHPGSWGADVRWLRERLERIIGESAGAADPRKYTEALKTMVKSFQREQGLAADGVAGARTFILLNNLDEQVDIPRLRMSPVETQE
jgi:general secretion pathway protein A